MKMTATEFFKWAFNQYQLEFSRYPLFERVIATAIEHVNNDSINGRFKTNSNDLDYPLYVAKRFAGFSRELLQSAHEHWPIEEIDYHGIRVPGSSEGKQLLYLISQLEAHLS